MPRPSTCEYNPEIAGLADRRNGPGILILTPSAQLLYMNRRSWDLLKRMNESQDIRASGGLLPVAVKDICEQIQKLERSHLASKDWEQVEIRRLAGADRHPVLLRGFGLPGTTAGSYSRVLIVMELIGRREAATSHAKERFQLTEREQSVVERLARGWTNKEIAAELNITEPTVKAHIRNIMEKTKCTTRTAIVAQLLHA